VLAVIGRNAAVADLKGKTFSGFPAWALWLGHPHRLADRLPQTIARARELGVGLPVPEAVGASDPAAMSLYDLRAPAALLAGLRSGRITSRLSVARAASARIRASRASSRGAYALERSELAVRGARARFANCIGLGAGFDKNASVLPGLGALGFGHVEIGT
jgi:hypothetical protein